VLRGEGAAIKADALAGSKPYSRNAFGPATQLIKYHRDHYLT
jgi:hypothetical protein